MSEAMVVLLVLLLILFLVPPVRSRFPAVEVVNTLVAIIVILLLLSLFGVV